MERSNRTRSRSEVSGWLLPGLVPPLLGIIAYALLRESYVWFYGQYGLVPEDVGLSQIRMLTACCGSSTCGRSRFPAARP